MLPETLTDFTDYFQNIQQQHKELKSFVNGGSEEIINLSRAELDYPCLWLEVPSLIPDDNGADQVSCVWHCAFLVLKNLASGDSVAVKAARQETQVLAMDVLSRMKRDHKNRLFHFDLKSVKIEPISTLFVDNDYGWRVEFTRGGQLDLCYQPEKWND